VSEQYQKDQLTLQQNELPLNPPEVDAANFHRFRVGTSSGKVGIIDEIRTMSF